MGIFTKFSLKNTLVIILAIILIIAGGLYATSSVQMEFMPNISFPVITVATIYPGAAPEDIAEGVSRPLQKSISAISGLKSINTISNENVSLLIAQFDFSKDMEKAQQEIQDAVNKIKLPDKAQKPNISRIGYNNIPVVSYSVSAQNMSENQLSDFIKDKVQPALSGVKGVANVSVNGLDNKSVYIKVDEQKLKDNNLTLQDLQQALSANDISFPTGTVDIDGQTLPLKVSRKVNNLNDIMSIPVIVMPDTSKIMTDSMGKVSEAIGGVYNAMGAMGKGMSDIGRITGDNTQAVYLLAVIQQNQSIILAQKEILSNPGATPEMKSKAQNDIQVATKSIAVSQKALSELLVKFSSLKNTAVSNPQTQKALPQNSGNSEMQIPGSSKESNSMPKITTVALGDIASVKLEQPEGMSYTRANQKPTVLLNLHKSENENAVQIAKDAEKKISELEKANPGFKFDKTNDTSKIVTQSVNGMAREGVLGALFAILIIALFLRDLRATLIAVVSIPLSILIALMLLPKFNISLNVMSLSGMAVAIGRIVDDSIVVIENIFRRIQKREADDEDIVQNATAEVSSAITSSTITTVAVFLPLSFVNGIIGKVFFSFAVTVVICILASLLVAVTVVPVMSKFMLLKRPPKHKKESGMLENAYKKLLGFALGHRAAVIVLAVILVIGSFILVSGVGVQFLPTEETRAISAKLSMTAGTSLEETNKEVQKFEEKLLKNPQVDIVTSSVGDLGEGAASWGVIQGSNEASLSILLKEKADGEKILAQIKEEAESLESSKAKWMITPQSSYGQQERMEVVVNGENIDDIRSASEMITSKLKEVNELSNTSNNLAEKKPEVSIKVDSQKAAENGLNPIYVAGMVRSMLNYDKITTIENEGTGVSVMLGLDKKKLSDVESIKNLELNSMSGKIAVKDIADVKVQDGPVSISERDGNRFASITADITSKDTAKVAKDVNAKIEGIKMQFKPGITYNVGGSVDDINESFKQMGMAMLLAIFLVFITMVLAFKEATAPLSILFSLPFAAVGALLALVVTKHPLSMSGLVGLLMLIGIVVTNAIVLVDRVQTNRKNGMSINESLLEAGAVRLRPIIMTAAATVMALIPLALGFSEGAIISEELGIVVIGGITVSTVLTLVIVPVAYSVLEGLKLKVLGKKVKEERVIVGKVVEEL